MTNSDLYKEELMDLYRNPSNKGSLDKPTVSVTKNNPMCGDEVTLQLKISEGKIKSAKFDGAACAVSVISSEVLTEAVEGMTIEDAKKITKEELLDKIGLNLTTSRVKCATLALNALQNALDGL